VEPWPGLPRGPFQPSRLLATAERTQLADRVYAFFDRYVRHDERPDGRRVLHYYTLNNGTWRSTTRAGDRIRLTIAAADPDAFQLLPATGKAAYRIGQGGAAPSYLELPVVE
jgi:hypothetical protein